MGTTKLQKSDQAPDDKYCQAIRNLCRSLAMDKKVIIAFNRKLSKNLYDYNVLYVFLAITAVMAYHLLDFTNRSHSSRR